MDRIKNVLIVALEIILVLAIVLIIIIYISTDSTEKNYNKAKAYIKSKNYGEAADVLKGIPHYKDSSELQLYIYPESLYYTKYTSDTSKLTAFNQAIVYIDGLKNSAAGKKYAKNLLQLRNTLEFKVEEINVKNQNAMVQAVIAKSAQMIASGDYLGASEKLNAIAGPNGEPEKSELLAYIDLLNADKSKDKKAVQASITLLDPNYSGVLNTQISTLVFTYVDLGKWGSMYKNNSQSLIEKGVVRLGMKKQDLLPILGKPIEDMQISNEYGVFEKMKYDKELLFFEDNVLNAIRYIQINN